MSDLYEKIADSHPDLKAGIVCCGNCGRELKVNTAHCLKAGWPECCGRTMVLLSWDDKVPK